MLEGLEVSEILNSDLLVVDTFRFDAEYFSKRFVSDKKAFDANSKNFTTLEMLGVEVNASAFYPSIEPAYGQGDLPFLRVADVNQTINYESATTIPIGLLSVHKTLKSVQPNDIVLTKGGSIARVGFVSRCAAVSRDLIFINSSKLQVEDANFLYLYFLTSFANRLLIRSSSQSVQAHLTLTLVKNIPCFKAGAVLKKELLKIANASKAAQKNARDVYTQAEALLLDTLGMADSLDGTDGLVVNIKSFKDSFAATGRLDAEYYQPKYDELRHILEHHADGVTTIGELAGLIANGAEVREYQEEGVAYLRVGDLKGLTIDAASVVRINPISAEKGLGKIDLQSGDVLVSRSGSLAITAVVEPEWANALISSHLIRLRVTDTRIDPYFLALFLCSKPGKMQTQQRSNGGVQPEINQPALKSILIPILPSSSQQEIRRLILKSRELHDASKNLLAVAKRAVEIAIEADEQTAMAYVNSQTGA